MDLELDIKLDLFKPVDYQLPLCEAFEEQRFRKLIAIWPRRAGKDFTVWNLLIRRALQHVGIYYYIFPTFAQGKRALWDTLTYTGLRFLSYIPPELIERFNEVEQKIRLKNGSLIQVVGSKDIDKLRGTNATGLIFSEYAQQDPRAYQVLSPILRANPHSWVFFVSTPFGQNHMYHLYEIAKQNPESFYLSFLTLDDTQHVSRKEIDEEIAQGLISEDMVLQEYYCSFNFGIEGTILGKYINTMKLDNRIGDVPWETSCKVHTFWDLGIRDSTTIIMAQVVGSQVRIIDCYENSGYGLEHYVKVLEQKPYTWGKHIAPHDISVRELGTGLSRLEVARQLGINFIIAPDLSLEDGIQAMRSVISRVWIDQNKCKNLIKALENYRREFDNERKIYKSIPLHDWSSHFCFTGDTLILTRYGMRPIMSIQNNDEVLTLKGWKKCSAAKLTKQNATLVEVIFQDGTIVKCTPDHLFLTANGWRSAQYLHKGIEIQSSLMNSRNTLMDLFTDYGPMKNIYPKEEVDYIEMPGETLLVKSQIDAISITKTTILKTTISGILNVFLRKFTLECQDQMERASVKCVEIRQMNGTLLLKVFYFIKDTLKNILLGKIKNEKEEIVFNVKKNSKEWSEGLMNKNSVILTARPLIIEYVKKIEEKADVWDITVPIIGHFSLSNGAIVHNSDAFRYMAISLPKTADGLTAEELDNRYKKAMWGSQALMPNFFRDDLLK